MTNANYASMEPRPHERGKHAELLAYWSPGRGFNGATSSRTWKAIGFVFVIKSLQGFNGATSSRTWKVAGFQMPTTWNQASMEPRPHERGKMLGDALAAQLASLQWSHVLTNVESSFHGQRRWLGISASMEPRPHERGKSGNGQTVGRVRRASMEPRPHERGKADVEGKPLRESLWLQWSHVLTNVESRAACFARCSIPGFNGATSSRTWKASKWKDLILPHWLLQWSHVLTNVERREAGREDAGKHASMEPRPHERGKCLLVLTR